MSWLQVLAKQDIELENSVKQLARERLALHKFTEQDCQYIAKLDFTPKISSDIDPQIFLMLRELCKLCDAKPTEQKISSHRKFVGPVIVIAKKLLFAIFGAFLKSRDEQQRKFNSQTLQILLKLAEKR